MMIINLITIIYDDDNAGNAYISEKWFLAAVKPWHSNPLYGTPSAAINFELMGQSPYNYQCYKDFLHPPSILLSYYQAFSHVIKVRSLETSDELYLALLFRYCSLWGHIKRVFLIAPHIIQMNTLWKCRPTQILWPMWKERGEGIISICPFTQENTESH